MKGIDTRGMVILWLAGSGFDEEATNHVLADPRVEWELKQTRIDGLGLLQAMQSAASRIGKMHEVAKGSLEQLRFLTVFR